MAERKYTRRHTDGTPYRGRPTVGETYYASYGREATAKKCYGGELQNNPLTTRTHANRVYAEIGVELLDPFVEAYPELERILPPRTLAGIRAVAKSGILEQLGRMKHQNDMNDQDILYAALMAVDAKERGVPSKHIEKALRRIRAAGTTDPEKW